MTHHGVRCAQVRVYRNELAFGFNVGGKPTAAFQTSLGLGAVPAATAYDGFELGSTTPDSADWQDVEVS